MNTDLLFQIANAWVIPGWILLWFFPSRKWTPTIILYLIILVLAILYSLILFTSEMILSPDMFSSLEGIKSMFKYDNMVLAGWIHYLAFDLAAGLLITRDSLAIGYHTWLRIPVLFFVFILGPFGMLLYLITRIYYIRRTKNR